MAVAVAILLFDFGKLESRRREGKFYGGTRWDVLFLYRLMWGLSFLYELSLISIGMEEIGMFLECF